MRFRNELGQRGMAQHTRRQSLEPINLGKEIASATGSKVRVPENTVVLEQTNQLRVCQRRDMLHRITQVFAFPISGHSHHLAQQKHRSVQFHLLRRQTVVFGGGTESAVVTI